MISGIIGRGGAVIRDLNARSGAKVRVSQKHEVRTLL
jgi:polyribonucleotide nucleotidyltransferase